MMRILQKAKFDFLVLVGDVYQIQSISFGNWFSTARAFVPKNAVCELQTPYRSTNEKLKDFVTTQLHFVGIVEIFDNIHDKTVVDCSLLFLDFGKAEIGFRNI